MRLSLCIELGNNIRDGGFHSIVKLLALLFLSRGMSGEDKASGR